MHCRDASVADGARPGWSGCGSRRVHHVEVCAERFECRQRATAVSDRNTDALDAAFARDDGGEGIGIDPFDGDRTLVCRGPGDGDAAAIARGRLRPAVVVIDVVVVAAIRRDLAGVVAERRSFQYQGRCREGP